MLGKRVTRVIIAGLGITGILLAGCVAGGGAKPDDSAEKMPAAAADGAAEEGIGEGAGAVADMADPWGDAADAEAAAKGAGLAGFSVPDKVVVGANEVGSPSFSYMDGVAQATYEAPAWHLVIRKGADGALAADIPGDRRAHARTWDVAEGGLTIACAGDEVGRALLAEWQGEDGPLSIESVAMGGGEVPMSDDEVVAIARAVS